MAENAVPYDYIIDADGLKESVSLLRTIDRYMDSIQRRVDRLSRMRVVIPIRLSDCLCEPIKRIRASLDSLTKSQWLVPVTSKVDLGLDPSIFEAAGRDAGKSFSSSFEAALDPTALLAKVKAALEGMQLKVTVAGGEGKGKKKGGIFSFDDDDYKDMLKDTISGALGSMLGDLGLDGLKKTGKGLKKLFKKTDDPTSPNNPNNPGKTLIDPQGNPLTSRKSFTTRLKDFGKNTIEFGKKAINRTKNLMGGGSGSGIVSSNTALTYSATEKSSLPLSKKSRGFSSSKRGFSGTSSQRTLTQAIVGQQTLSQSMNNPVPKLAGSKLLMTAGKWIKPLGYIATAASIAKAKPGEERNKLVRGAAGNAAGTAIGAALGSIVPGAGTLVGGLVGGYVGEKLAEGKVGKAVQSWVSSGSKWVRGLVKKKPKKNEANSDEVLVASSPPENKSALQRPSKAGIGVDATLGRSGTGALGQSGLLGGLLPIAEWFKSKLNGPSAPVAGGASISPFNPGNAQRLPLTAGIQPSPTRQPANPPAPTININIPAGAVQLTVKETEIDYNAITAQISTRLSASIRQTLENRP